MWKRLDESIALSEKLATLSWPALGVWTYLLAQTDTMGRFHRDVRIVKAKCMTLRYDLRLEVVEEALLEIEKAGLLHCFDVEGKTYLVLHDYREFNPPGALGRVSPKYPTPPGGLCRCVDSERRASGVRTPDVTSPSTSLSSSGEDGGVGEEEELAGSWPPTPATPRGHLWKLFLKAKITGTPGQKRQYFEAWYAQAGAQRFEQILMDQKIVGKDVFAVQRWYFNDFVEKRA